jgi:hypothetical protein
MERKQTISALGGAAHWNYVSSDKNRNVWAVLSYLTGFLNHIGVPTDALASPPT